MKVLKSPQFWLWIVLIILPLISFLHSMVLSLNVTFWLSVLNVLSKEAVTADEAAIHAEEKLLMVAYAGQFVSCVILLGVSLALSKRAPEKDDRPL